MSSTSVRVEGDRVVTVVTAAQAFVAEPLTLRPVRQGDQYTRQALGGFVRDRAPVDGFAWEAGDACGFIAEKDVQAATVELKLNRQGFKAAKPGKVRR